jgi:hypothetical protein
MMYTMCEIDFTHPSYFVYSILHVSLSCKIDFGKYQEPNQLHPQLPLQLSYISNNTNCHTNCITTSHSNCIAKINTNSHPNCNTKSNANIIAKNNAYGFSASMSGKSLGSLSHDLVRHSSTSFCNRSMFSPD